MSAVGIRTRRVSFRNQVVYDDISDDVSGPVHFISCMEAVGKAYSHSLLTNLRVVDMRG